MSNLVESVWDKTTGQQYQAARTGLISNIQRYSLKDGPGIRTTVFFKGCPLKCLWCDNPETQKAFPQILYYDTLCTRSYRCVAVCPEGATTVGEEGKINIDRERCKACGTCIEACPSGARVMAGQYMTVEEVVEEVTRDSLFYLNSGGGVTASGGEPVSQPGFLLQFFSRCQEKGLHTALETCGYAPWEVLKGVLQYVDLVLFDIKHMDSARHRELTGVGNELILENLKRIALEKKTLIARVPLIPGCTDSEENILTLGNFLTIIGIKRVDLMPYHQLGIRKYRCLGRTYDLGHLKQYDKQWVEEIRGILEYDGREVTIG